MAPQIGVGEMPLACVGCFYSGTFNPSLDSGGELIPAVYAELPPMWEGMVRALAAHTHRMSCGLCCAGFSQAISSSKWRANAIDTGNFKHDW